MHESEACGYSEASSAFFPRVCVPFLHTGYKHTSLIRKLSGINGWLNLIHLRRKNNSLIGRSTWNQTPIWATSCQQNARQKLNKIQTIQEILLQILKRQCNVRKTSQHFLSTDNGWQFQETSIQGQNRIKTQTGGRSNPLTYRFHWTKICARIREQNTKKRTTKPLLFLE